MVVLQLEENLNRDTLLIAPLFSIAVLLFVSIATPEFVLSQDVENRFEKDIQRFEAADRANPPQPGNVLFLGSSSIHGWDLEKWFPDQGYLNRGFGGSHIADSIFFFNRIVAPYKPRAIVFYAGDNDIAAGKTPDRVFADFRSFVKLTKEKLPDAEILFIAIKPSLARWNRVKKMRECNRKIADFAQQNSSVKFVDIDGPMIGKNGRPKPELFAKDGLHLNEKGYRLWTSILQPKLRD